MSYSEPILNDAVVAERFGLSISDYRRYRKLQLISVTVETGSKENDGLRRLLVCFANRVWRADLGANDTIVQEEMTFLRGKLSRALR
ncbi:hypothetical protein ELI02_28845 (plasmid) [Rhizobium leguminosarum]|uniref:Uncharacterized protein n=1 Tax=Rhizobium leguminosarum TaxID=384 RepID=A0A4V2II40_RHILE|nr:hypothetical protein ELI04_33600 [Rhizobium leguminosarum]TAX45737.1 hypothetical protein ELI02_28845 [Rhizobium leguminosarum]TAX46546.1 hypothetical protein ELI01_30715 [Rhizobium leguminosarum]TAX64445.1 hypothetical protein ELI03_34965 [Rhizobium leguminosarum]